MDQVHPPAQVSGGNSYPQAALLTPLYGASSKTSTDNTTLLSYTGNQPTPMMYANLTSLDPSMLQNNNWDSRSHGSTKLVSDKVDTGDATTGLLVDLLFDRNNNQGASNTDGYQFGGWGVPPSSVTSQNTLMTQDTMMTQDTLMTQDKMKTEFSDMTRRTPLTNNQFDFNSWQTYPNQQYFPNQTYPNQQYFPNQTYPNQQYFPNQTYPNQPYYPNQTYNNQSYYPNQMYYNETYPNQSYSNQSYPNSQFPQIPASTVTTTATHDTFDDVINNYMSGHPSLQGTSAIGSLQRQVSSATLDSPSPSLRLPTLPYLQPLAAAANAILLQPNLVVHPCTSTTPSGKHFNSSK